MKKILLFLTSIFFAIIFLSTNQKPVFSSHNNNNLCLGIYGTVNATNWPGGNITVSCEGTPLALNPDRNCPGDSVSVMPGQSFDLGLCSCPPFADGCLTISSLPPGCTSTPASKSVCGTNAQSIDSDIQITCPRPTSTPAPTPRPKTSPCPSLGDVDNDGLVSNVDATWVNEYIAGRRTFTQDQIERADVNDTPNTVSTGSDVNVIDYNLILQYLAGSISTFPACPTAAPTPTLIPSACNVTCTRDADCQADIYSNSNQCTACVSGICKVPPACNTQCVRDSDCQGARDFCTSCINNTCQRPPTLTPTSAPTPTPTNIPPPTATPTQMPSPTSTPILPPTSTPTPAFNPDSCKCDFIEYTALFSGQPTTITAYGKVEGADIQRAKIVSTKFTLYKSVGGSVSGNPILAETVPATVVSSTPQLVRYKSVWNFTVPNLEKGADYRIGAVVNDAGTCQPKLQAINYSPARKTVLGTSMPTQSKSFIDRMIEFLNNLFGGPKAATTTSTPTPTSEPGTGAGMIFEEPTPTGKKSLQLEPIYPLEVYQKTCSFIKFRSQLN